MRTLFTTFLALLLATLMFSEPAQAKRFGGGFSLGKSYSAPKRIAPAPTATQRQSTQQPTMTSTTQRPRTGLGGMVGGLLAGGLLGALFFGGGFDGIKPIDIMLIALAGLVIYRLFLARTATRPSYAGAADAYDGDVRQQWSGEQPTIPTPPEYGGVADNHLVEPQLDLPDWFNKRAFIEQACQHFTHLQRAWDLQNWDEIRSYTSPELFESLQQERARAPGQQHTAVESVMAELINFIDQGEQVVVSIHFYGWLREDEQSGTTEFSEIWHLVRDMRTENADWLIVGIEQPS